MEITQSSSSSNVLLGAKGAVIITDTAVHTGPFYSFKAISQCVVDTAVLESSVTGSLNGLTILAGDTVMLYRITSIKLTSGAGVAYKV